MREYKRGMKILEGRLQSWAEYYVSPIHGLSYSPSTVEARLMEYGSGASQSGKPSATVLRYMPHLTASETDIAISSMPSEWGNAIKYRYVEQVTQKQAAEMMGLKERKYAYTLRDAHVYLAAK